MYNNYINSVFCQKEYWCKAYVVSHGVSQNKKQMCADKITLKIIRIKNIDS